MLPFCSKCSPLSSSYHVINTDTYDRSQRSEIRCRKLDRRKVSQNMGDGLTSNTVARVGGRTLVFLLLLRFK